MRVDYTYDQLNRLSTAVSRTGATTNWGLQFGYDIYGNRTSQSVTAGSAPQSTFAFDNNNRMIGYSYDANGNQLSTPDGGWLEYDADNRMTRWNKPSTGATEQYQYHPAGWRVWKGASYSTAAFSLYGPGGQLQYDGSSARDHVYFGGRLLYTMSGSSRLGMYRDRLGSVRYTESLGLYALPSATRNFYPFGEEVGATTVSDEPKFAGTFRDATSGLDYALNRYYSSNTGRFLIPEPLGLAAADPANPAAWNRYSYVANDPVNYVDRDGLRMSLTMDGLGETGPVGSGCFFIGDIGCIGPFPPAFFGVVLPPRGRNRPSCEATVAFSGSPRHNQTFAGSQSPPPDDQLGSYRRPSDPGVVNPGWYFAVQIQVDVMGDTDPADWTIQQTVKTSGSLTVATPGGYRKIRPGPPGRRDDAPKPLAVTTGQGFIDWIDAPGVPFFNEQGTVLNADVTWEFESKARHGGSGASCSVRWSLHVVVTNPEDQGRWKYQIR